MNPLTRRPSAVLRPHIAVAVLFAFALWTAPAEAGRRSRRAKRPSSPAAAQVEGEKTPDRGGEKRKRRRSKRSKKKARAAIASPEAGLPDSPPPAANPRSTSPSPPASGTGEAAGREQVFDFSGLELTGSVRMPQLLYFLDRAEEELERASLERRSFVPAMMRSLDEESL